MAWNHTVALPDRNAGRIFWQVAPAATMAAYFTPGAGTKRDWMSWGQVRMTEDYGEYEWIIRHPAGPQGVTYYRDRLAEVAQGRAALRAALPVGDFVLAMNNDPGAQQAVMLGIGNTDRASAQFTFESTDRAVTKKVLLEGLTSGLDRAHQQARETFANADADVSTTVATATARIAPIAGVGDMELIVAFIFGDLCHKVATRLTGPSWAGAIAANFKQWRTMFPKSHPSQVLYQALDGMPGHHTVNAVSVALTGQQAAISQDVLDLFARKVLARTVRVEWGQDLALGIVGLDPNSGNIDDEILTSAMTAAPIPPTVPVVPGAAAVATSLANFLARFQANFVATEFTNVVAALCDVATPKAAVDVVRSTSFAQHPAAIAGQDKGFAAEDRAEVATTFPDLASCYERIKGVVDRY